ncbi:MAG: galactokinase [Ignavibacteriales bacterium]|nr:galactokinase [Ignavibacteriales bacterium]
MRPLQHPSPDVLLALYNCPPGELAAHHARYDRLTRLFGTHCSGTPQYIVRAPGRVNLIGEHTDYNGYPVLPMAIDRDFVFVVAAAPGLTVQLRNEDPSFEIKTFNAALPLSPYPQGDWGNYVKAAVHGILEAGWVDPKHAHGFDAIVGGTIPESAGLSSSSALVVASALAFLAANNTKVEAPVLADLLARAERYVGSEGGGMDQAVSLLAETGTALKIDFFPLRTESIPLPENMVFVVCNSLIRAPKSESVRYEYNRRVIECRMATALLTKAVRENTGTKISPLRLADLSAERLGIERAVVNGWALAVIGERPLSLNEIAQRLGKTPESIEKELCTLQDGSTFKEPPKGFRVWNRYRHVVSEAERVHLMVHALQEGNPAEIGSLMNQSHASCRDDYEISCPELEALVSVARDHGALGARLTGAGFGGCTVNAVPAIHVEQFLKGVKGKYYEGYVKREKKGVFTAYRDLRDVLFPCRASKGAGYWPAAELMG